MAKVEYERVTVIEARLVEAERLLRAGVTDSAEDLTDAEVIAGFKAWIAEVRLYLGGAVVTDDRLIEAPGLRERLAEITALLPTLLAGEPVQAERNGDMAPLFVARRAARAWLAG